MGGINFISGQKPDKRKDDPQIKKPGVVWTKPSPEAGGADDNRSNNPEEAVGVFEYSGEDATGPVSALPEKPAADNQGGSGWIKKIFSGPKKNTEDPGHDNDFKNNKELLADHREILKKEKQLRNPDKTEFIPVKHNEGLFTTPIRPETVKNKIKIKSFKDLKDIILSFGKNKLAASQILKTNLIQGEVTTFFDWKKNLWVLALDLIYAGLVVCVIYVGLIYWESRISERGEEVIAKIQEIVPAIKKAETEAEKIDVFQKKVDLVSQIFGQHVYWTNFFKFLEESTLVDAYYTSKFSGDSKGEYTFDVEVADYKSVADQIAVLQKNEFVTGVTVGSANYKLRKNSAADKENAEMGVVFKLKIKLKPEIFYK